MTPRLHEWLLRTPAEQLEKESTVSNPETEKSQTYLDKSTEFLDCFKEDADSKALDLAALKTAINNLESNSKLPNKEILKELQQKIAELQKPRPVRAQDLIEVARNPPASILATR
ncbi:MAG: hypothetical protein O2793_17600 [Proteobacteria bacterium]|nr:hypothetical protein [Pseudomonadota bacterium]